LDCIKLSKGRRRVEPGSWRRRDRGGKVGETEVLQAGANATLSLIVNLRVDGWPVDGLWLDAGVLDEAPNEVINLVRIYTRALSNKDAGAPHEVLSVADNFVNFVEANLVR
jgi:hypothetical protein